MSRMKPSTASALQPECAVAVTADASQVILENATNRCIDALTSALVAANHLKSVRLQMKLSASRSAALVKELREMVKMMSA